MVKRAREFRGTPAPARAAATVVLLRPAGETFEVYVLRRASTMVFGGAYAFPGGGVDPGDRPATLRADWSDRLGVDEDQARAIVGAAARELFEEAGVLLAGPTAEPDRTVSDGSLTGVVTHVPDPDETDATTYRPDADETGAIAHAPDPDETGAIAHAADADGTVGDVGAADWEADRAAVQRRELTMTELFRRRGLRLRDDLLLPWSRWITPEFEPKRFDTWFFVALLPQAQTARDVSGEADRTMWISPAAADGLAMLPPTRSTLNSLAAYRKIAEVVAAASRRDAATPVTPRVELLPDGGAAVRVD